MTKKKVSFKEFNELKAKLEARENMHREYMQLLQNKFEIRIPAKLLIGSSIFNLVLVDEQNKPVEQVKPVILEKPKEPNSTYRSYIT